MKIKVQCPCGSKFEFEAEPVDGKMPWALSCPACNADATGLANEVIRQQLEPAKPKLSIKGHGTAAPAAAPAAAPPPPAPPTGSKLRINMPHHGEKKPEAAAPAKEGAPPAAAPATTASTWTNPAANNPNKAGGRRKGGGNRGKLIGMLAGGVVAVAALSAWGWYAFVGSLPKVAYTVKPGGAGGEDGGASYHLVGPGQLLSFTGDKIALYDVTKKAELWTATVESKVVAPAPKAAAAKAPAAGARAAGAKRAGVAAATNGPASGGLDAGAAMLAAAAEMSGASKQDIAKAVAGMGMHLTTQPVVVPTASEIWIIFPDRLEHFDRTTGARREDIGLPAPVLDLTYNDEAILAVSLPDWTHKVITQVALSSGAMSTEEIDLTPKPVVRAAPVAAAATPAAQPGGGRRRPGPVQPVPAAAPLNARYARAAAAGAAPAAAAADQTEAPLDHLHAQFYGTGPNVVELVVKLVEEKTQTTDTMKPKGKSILESGKLTAGQSMDAVQEMMNDMKRANNGGKKTVDVSRYAVTLRRRFSSGAPDWSGEVVGRPEFFSLKTVDILAAGTEITVFDKENKKRFNAKLTYPITEGLRSPDGHVAAPCLETADTLYFADKGMLTAFDSNTGEVRWRLTSVGISHIQVDEQGKIYLNTSTASPDSIQFSDEVDLKNRPEAVIMKVDPATGKTLWKAQKVGEDCVLSGKFVYGMRSSTSYAWLRLEDGPQNHFNVYRLNPRTGGTVWNYNQPRAGIKSEADHNWLMLQFGDEIQVLNFLSL